MLEKREKPKKEKASTAAGKQPSATKEETSEEQEGSEKDESAASNVKQQSAIEGETPKKRGRPKKEEGSTQNAKSPGTSKPAKRGRPKQEATPQTPKRNERAAQDKGVKESPKKRVKLGKESESAAAAEPAGVPAVDTDAPKKRGRPKKVEGVAQVAETQAESTADTPKKRGRPKKSEDIAEATTVPQGSSTVDEGKKRGRPSAAEQGESSKVLTPGKRGRPKKVQAAVKGAKPVGVVKKRAGRK